MKSTFAKLSLIALLWILPAAMKLGSSSVEAQPSGRPPYGYGYGEQVSLQPLLAQIDEFQKTTRTAPIYYEQGGYDLLWRKFQALRASYAGFKGALNPNQLYEGANDLAELDSGLDIIQESFTNYQKDSASGAATSATFRSLCGVLSRSVTLWSQQTQTVWGRLQYIRY